jgi:hypothetical protein
MAYTRHLLAAAAVLATALPAVAAPALAASAPPETRLCLENRDIRTKDLSPVHGYFARTAQGWWRNTGAACAAYARDRALTTQSTSNRQCRGDVVTVFEPFSRIAYGGCVLGAWERVSAPPKD